MTQGAIMYYYRSEVVKGTDNKYYTCNHGHQASA